MGREFSDKNIVSGGLRKPGNNLFIAEVVAVGKIPKPTRRENRNEEDKKYDDKTNRSLEAFNTDEHAIRVVIVGNQYDGGGDYPDLYNLPNCFPLMPKHTNLVPKKGEFVIVMLIGDDERYNDRFYIGPIISSSIKLNKDDSITSLANFVDGTTYPTPNIIPNGVYENKQNVVIEGRENTDIIQRANEVLIRAGKFKLNSEGAAKPEIFNNLNPAYIQIKSDFNITETNESLLKTTKKGSVTNIVANRINLLSYDGSPNFTSGKPESRLTKVGKRDEQGNVTANYIDDEQLEEILKGAHQLVFGDVLVKYLVLMRKALLGHHHNRDVACDHDVMGEKEVANFSFAAEILEEAMLSKNIRIN
tara:strand:+ start:449 stop:1531 length:1083 start_codon:yes stop_codon:yes gene_type:complete